MVQIREDLIKTNSMNYQEYLSTMTEDQRSSWKEHLNMIEVDNKLVKLVKSPSLPINIIAFSGAWCPECALAVSILEKIVCISSFITLHIVDREKLPSVYEKFMPNGDKRVPVIIFASEDFYTVTSWIERSAKKYGLLWEVLQKSKNLPKQKIFDELANIYKENESLIIQSTLEEIGAELIRSIGIVNYSTRLNSAL